MPAMISQSWRDHGFDWNRAPGLLLLVSLVSIATVGAVSLRQYNMLPSDRVLEVVFFLSSMMALRHRMDKSSLIFAVIAFVYVALTYLLMELLKPAGTKDFLVAYKAFIYIIPLTLFIGRAYIEPRSVRRAFVLLLTLFFLKYSYVWIAGSALHVDVRPGIFTENNYELPLLLMLYCIITPYLRGRKVVYFAVLTVIVFMSRSRSVLAELLLVYLFTFLERRGFKAWLATIALPILVLLVWRVYEVRMPTNVGAIDRVRFLMTFLHEVRHWDIGNVFFGTVPLTPLSASACASLSYYSTLFSFTGNGSCYAVILHSYVLRVLFNHGLMAFMFLLSFLWYGLVRVGYQRRQILGIFGVTLACAMSVSSYNSVYVAIGFAIAFSCKQRWSSSSNEHNAKSYSHDLPVRAIARSA